MCKKEKDRSAYWLRNTKYICTPIAMDGAQTACIRGPVGADEMWQSLGWLVVEAPFVPFVTISASPKGIIAERLLG